jgi:hypothetical protein
MEVTPDGTVHKQLPVEVILSTVYVPTTVDVVTHGCGVEVRVKELVVTVALLASVTLIVIALEAAPPDVVPLPEAEPPLPEPPVVPLLPANVPAPPPIAVKAPKVVFVPLVAGIEPL